MTIFSSPLDVRKFWTWNVIHKSGKWRFTSLNTLLKSVESDSEKSGYAMFQSCQLKPCRVCELKGAEKLEHSHGCYENPCVCYLSLSQENQQYWLNLVKHGLCGYVGRKWYLGKSPDEAR